MSVSENLKAAVSAHNIDDIRGSLWSCIAIDPSLSGKFQESLNYALANGISETELFEEDNGEPFSTEPTQHNFSELGGMIRINFSKKKIDALGNIGRILYPPKNKATEKNEASSSDDGRSPQQKSETASPGATLVGAAIGAAAGAIIGKVVIGGAIAVIGGLVLGAAAGAAIAGTAISRKD